MNELNEHLAHIANHGEGQYADTTLAQGAPMAIQRIRRTRVATRIGAAAAGVAVIAAGAIGLANVTGWNASTSPAATPTPPMSGEFVATDLVDCDGVLPSTPWDIGALPTEALCEVTASGEQLRADAAVSLGEFSSAWFAETGEYLCISDAYVPADSERGTVPISLSRGVGVTMCSAPADVDERSLRLEIGERFGWSPAAVSSSELSWDFIPPENLVTVVAGERLDDAIETIAAASRFREYDVRGAVERLATELPGDENFPLEGWILAGTYNLSLLIDDNPDALVSQLIGYNQELQANAEMTDEEWHRVLTIASIIEREGQRPEYFARISGVIDNRLDLGMALELDSTVHFYAVQDGAVFTTAEDRNSDNPYNTYRFLGLPPGPISSPSIEAIEAALSPADTSDLFFVTVDLVSGETLFAETYEEHLENVRLLQDWLRENN